MSTATSTDQLETILVPLHKLTAWSGNVRKTNAENSIDSLAASIQAVGLLQSLVIRKPSKTKYHVVAGKRRLLALSKLAMSGVIENDFPVPCRVLPKDCDQTEVSLAENVQHETMHPADEFEAFRALIDNGHSIADIAARFGLSELTVEKRLALARVSPLLIQKYREGELTLELLQAFALTDDHEAQEQVWNQLPRYDREPDTVREILSRDDVPGSDKRVQFVGVEAYEAAGGKVKRDLFADNDTGEGIYLTDAALLNRLVNEKLEATAQSLTAQGWKWVEIQPEPSYTHTARYRRLQPESTALPLDAQAKLDALLVEREQLNEDLQSLDEEEEEQAEPLEARLDEIEDSIRELRAQAQASYSAKAKAAAGVILSIDYRGKPVMTYGCVRKEDEPAFAPAALPSSATVSSPDRIAITAANETATEPEGGKGPYSAALIESLTTHKTVAIAAELAQNHHVALASVVYSFALSVYALDLRLYGTRTCLQLSLTQPALEELPDSKAAAYLGGQHAHWRERLPGSPKDLWQWCVDQDDATLLAFLAYLAATSVNAVEKKHDIDSGSRLPHAAALAATLQLDMTRWFQPTAENFFDRISKARIADVLREAGKEFGSIRSAMKKPELAKVAESDLAGTGWLPEPLRPQPELAGQLDGPRWEEEEPEQQEESQEAETEEVAS